MVRNIPNTKKLAEIIKDYSISNTESGTKMYIKQSIQKINIPIKTGDFTLKPS